MKVSRIHFAVAAWFSPGQYKVAFRHRRPQCARLQWGRRLESLQSIFDGLMVEPCS